MAAIKLLKLGSDGYPVEHTGASDDITFASVTISGSLVASSTGIDMNNKDLTDLNLLSFTDPTTDGITQTAGLLIVDNVMAKERSNSLTTGADILFPTISDSAGQVDALRLPVLAGVPTATPTASSEGFAVWDSSSNKLYIWNGAAWTNDIAAAASSSAVLIDTTTYVADTPGVSARDAVFVSSADKVSPCDANAALSSNVIGFATGAAASTAAVSVQKSGVLAGFTGLTATAPYYLSETAGAITSTPPTTSGATIMQVGFATSTTKLDIGFDFLGRRA